MAISEAQLTTWESQGSTGQFTASYQSIRNILLNTDAPYPVSNCEVFLQGSYGNDTNVYGDSDVDVVLKNSSTFYSDISALSPEDKAAWNQAFSGNASYPYANFRTHALTWIQNKFNGATPGRKAIWVPASGNRREADIVVAQNFRRWRTFKPNETADYAEGICFFSGATRIENFPKQHSANCTAKHQATGGWFKPTVRVFKNMRNAMIRDGYLAEGIAPSYFLEGMLYNVPNEKFGGNHVSTWINCFNWVVTATANKLVCANQLHWLVLDNTATSWPVANFNAFTAAAKQYWERWIGQLILQTLRTQNDNMQKLLKLFMWGYQPHFRISLELLARRAVLAVGVDAKPEALLVGVRRPETAGPNPVCVEPEFEKWPLALFDHLPAAIEEAYPKHEGHKMFYSDERSMEDKPEKIRRSVVRAEVQRCLKTFDDEFEVSSFVGYPRQVGDYDVVPVLQVPRSVLTRYALLKTDRKYLRDYRPQASYLHAVIFEVLEGATRELETPEPGYHDFDGARSDEEIARQAAISFLRSPLLATARDRMYEEAFGVNLLTSLNAVSSQLYEHAPGMGRMLLANPDNPNVKFALRFPKPISFRDTRWVRKLLQMAGGESSLIANGGGIWGLGTLLQFDRDAENTFWVDFVGHSQWNLRLDANIIFQSKLGQPSVLVEAITRDRFVENFLRVLPGTTDAQAHGAWELMQAAIKEPRGCMVIFADDASAEAARLSRQGMLVTPFRLSADLLTSLCKIDGSILCDTDGICYAIGVILDGAANENCTPARGSRYNSAVRYALVGDHARLAIVRSDDGELDVIPLTMPRISRKEFTDAISALENSTIENYHKPRNYLDEHRFYALPEDCARINAALERILAAPQEVGELRFPTQPFVPNPAMESDYFAI